MSPDRDPTEIGPPSRRDVLRAVAIAPLLGAGGARSRRGRRSSCILIQLAGGPSQLDTWDMKPDAPEEVRGPFRPIATNVPGIVISEVFPRLARRVDRVALVRSVHHDGPATHEAGRQLIETGRTGDHPDIASVVRTVLGEGRAAAIGRDQTVHDRAEEPAGLRERYGASPIGRACLLARRQVERGAAFVSVRLDTAGWDAHGRAPFPGLSAYRDSVGPAFDLAYSALLDDLAARGMLDSTLVVASGEFGRTARLNPSGGRDHHPGCWTALVAGGGVRGGQVIGVSDRIGEEPIDRPVRPAEIVATIYEAVGIDPEIRSTRPGRSPVPLVEPGVRPIAELYG